MKTTVNNLTIEQMREIVSGAPEGATHFQKSYRIWYFKETNQGIWGYPNNEWIFMDEKYLIPGYMDELTNLNDLRTILDSQPKFKIGDQVLFVDTERFTDDLLDIKYHKENGKFVVTNGWVSWKVDEEEIRHATAEEIKAGYNADHCSDIRNHVSPNCKIMERNNESE